MRKIFEQWGKCCLRLKRSAFNLFGWGKSYSRLKRSAFTLAEVLIVLAIIGVVAVMTIPTLMNKVAKQEYVAGLKTLYCHPSNANDASCKPFFDNLKKYFRFSVVTAPSYQTYPLKVTKGIDDYTGKTVLAFADGSVMFYGDFWNSASKANSAKSALIAE